MSLLHTVWRLQNLLRSDCLLDKCCIHCSKWHLWLQSRSLHYSACGLTSLHWHSMTLLDIYHQSFRPMESSYLIPPHNTTC